MSTLTNCNLPETTEIVKFPSSQEINLRDNIINDHAIYENIEKISKSTTLRNVEDSPYRYMDTLRTLYPNLYHCLNNVPPTELMRRLEIERLRTSYMNDFCTLPKLSEELYESLEKEDDKIKINQFYADKEKIQNIKNVVNEPKPNYTRSVSIDSRRCALKFKKPINEIELPNTTEYKSNICKTGCIILKNRIHDHSKCTKIKNTCTHNLKNLCEKPL